VLSRYAFDDPSGVMGKLAYDLGNVYLAPGIIIHNTSTLFGVMQRSLEEIAAYPGINPAPFQHSLDAIDKAASGLGNDQSRREDAPLIRREFALAVRMLRHACRRGLLALETDGGRKTSQSGFLSQDLDELKSEYKTIWLERNRPGGLEESLAFFKSYNG